MECAKEMNAPTRRSARSGTHAFAFPLPFSKVGKMCHTQVVLSHLRMRGGHNKSTLINWHRDGCSGWQYITEKTNKHAASSKPKVAGRSGASRKRRKIAK